MSEPKELFVVNTIVSQIMAIDKWALPSYAAQNFDIMMGDEDYQGGLKFDCNGYKVKGYTTIQLSWDDTYTIDFYGKDGSLMKQSKGVYFDQLVEVLDYIEEQDSTILKAQISLN